MLVKRIIKDLQTSSFPHFLFPLFKVWVEAIANVTTTLSMTKWVFVSLVLDYIFDSFTKQKDTSTSCLLKNGLFDSLGFVRLTEFRWGFAKNISEITVWRKVFMQQTYEIFINICFFNICYRVGWTKWYFVFISLCVFLLFQADILIFHYTH